MHTDQAGGRLYFLDWLRILAFFLLIFYHVGMYYVSWDFHVKSADAGPAIEPLMMLSSPWRLDLLFLISGAASAFMLKKSGALAFLRRRSGRLLLPLLFGMLVIVPPQSYCEVIEKVAYAGGYGDFMKLYLTGYHGFCRGHDCLIMPTWNHLWFIAYLWCYTVVLGMLALLPGAPLERLSAWVARNLAGWRLIVFPAAVLAALRMALRSRFPDTHALIDDWFLHASYLSLFLLGAMMAPHAAVWRGFEALRWHALVAFFLCWAMVVIFNTMPDTMIAPGYQSWALPPMRAVYALCAWSAICAACGFARRHLDIDGPARRYLTLAVFPVYVLHQSFIVVFAHALKPVHLPPVTEAMVLVVLTTGCCYAMVEVIRRIPVLQPLFGYGGSFTIGKRLSRPAGTPAAPYRQA
jgi:glucan biosynthesis protein C